LLEQGKYILKAIGAVLILVLLIRAVAVFVIIRVINDIRAIAVEDIPRVPRLEVVVGVETALAVVKEATPLAKPRVSTLAPILVIKAQFSLREVLISAAC